MAQITINIQTLDWTMGETVGLHLMLKKDSKARIAWGDGKVQVVTGKQKPASEKLAWVEAGHAYPEKGMYYTTLPSVRKRRMPLSDLMDVACSR